MTIHRDMMDRYDKLEILEQENAALKKRVEELKASLEATTKDADHHRTKREEAEVKLAAMTKDKETWLNNYHRRSAECERLREAVEKHRSYIWGEHPIKHEADKILYAVLDEALKLRRSIVP